MASTQNTAHLDVVGKRIARIEAMAINQLRIHFTDGSNLTVDADSFYMPSPDGDTGATVATIGLVFEDN